MTAKSAIGLVFLFVWVNLPMAIAHAGRMLRARQSAPVYLGFEGPILCTTVLLLVDVVGPTAWLVFLAPWALHAGTWIKAYRLLKTD